MKIFSNVYKYFPTPEYIWLEHSDILTQQVVLGHEMAHSVIGHAAEQLTRASFIQVIE